MPGGVEVAFEGIGAIPAVVCNGMTGTGVLAYGLDPHVSCARMNCVENLWYTCSYVLAAALKKRTICASAK